MKKALIIIFFLKIFTPIIAQEKMPEWVNAFNQEKEKKNPNVEKVIKLNEAYYKTHPFIKNNDTWNYKMWLRDPETWGEDIYVQRKNQNSLRAEYISKRKDITGKRRLLKSNLASWRPVGPIVNLSSNGNPMDYITHVRCVAVSQSDPNRLYCATEPGEVYKSIDRGVNWTNISYGPELFMSGHNGATAIGVHPENPDIVFVGGETRLYRSINGGENWTELNYDFGIHAYKILFHKENHDTLFVLSRNQFLISKDGGETFEESVLKNVYDICQHPINPSIVYAVTKNESKEVIDFYKSIDGGFTWSQRTSTTGWYTSNDPNAKANGAKLAVTKANPSVVYAYLIGDSTAGDDNNIGLFKSIDNGENWMVQGTLGGPYTGGAGGHPNVTSGRASMGMFDMAVSPKNENHILVGGVFTFQSLDGGETFYHANTKPENFRIHVDIRDMISDDDGIWICSDGGLSYTNDCLISHAELKHNGMHGLDFWGFDIGWHRKTMIGGLYHNGVTVSIEDYNEKHFANIGGGEPSTGYVNPHESNKVYWLDNIVQISDSHFSNVRIGNLPKRSNEFYWPVSGSWLTFHPNNYNVFYTGAEKNKLWKTEDGGETYNLVQEFTEYPGYDVGEIEISSNNPDVIYVTLYMRFGNTEIPALMKTIDGGETWNKITPPLLSDRNHRLTITIDPANDNNIWTGLYTGGGTMGSVFSGSQEYQIHKSTNGGETWENVASETLIGETCQDLIHVAGTDGGVYFCSQNSVFYRDNTMSDWQIQDNGLPFYISTNYGRVWYKGGKFLIGTFGRSVWETDINTPMSAPVSRIMVDKFSTPSSGIGCEQEVDSFYFDDHSFLRYEDDAINTWNWEFPSGTPSTSTERSPVVKFFGTGTHKAILTVTDINGNQSTSTLEVEITGDKPNTLSNESFESGIPVDLNIVNDDGLNTWALANNGAQGSDYSLMMSNNGYIAGREDFFTFYADVGADQVLAFDHAYGIPDNDSGDMLEISVSRNCGETWDVIYLKAGEELATVSNGTSYPSISSWKTNFIDLSSYEGANGLYIKFKNTSAGKGNLYIDNIRIDASLTTGDNIIASNGEKDIYFPNPLTNGQPFKIISFREGSFNLTLFTLDGKEIYKNIHNNGDEITIPNVINNSMLAYIVVWDDYIKNGILMVK